MTEQERVCVSAHCIHVCCVCLLPLLGLGHEQDLLLYSLVRFARRANVDHSRAPQVTSGQALHSRGHSGCKHDRLQTEQGAAAKLIY